MSESEKDKTKTTVRIEKDKTRSQLVYLRETASDLARKWKEARAVKQADVFENGSAEITELNHASERVLLALSVIEHAPAIEIINLARDLRKLYLREGIDSSSQLEELDNLLPRVVKAVEKMDGVNNGR